MPTNVRLLTLQDDLLRAARQLDELGLSLNGHARYLHYSIHRAEVSGVNAKARELRGSAVQMREIARTLTP
ncbi:hypothetical protein ACQKPE_01595 [Pseudomonas sp. NPDC089554]|uniref:hypothetical protein n=1 Tax=Pseudomonas sp. NPDC089554 TaxID=3390653 RepID=UPI003CFD4C3B